MLMLGEVSDHKAAQDIAKRPCDNSIRPKLRTLSLNRFDGERKDWMEFWNSYEATIEKNEAQSDKFEYLKDCLERKAK